MPELLLVDNLHGMERISNEDVFLQGFILYWLLMQMVKKE